MEPIRSQNTPGRGTAIVTGAGRGIGAAIAVELAEANFSIGLMGRDQGALELIAAECRAAGIEARCYRVDLRNGAETTETIERIAAELGGITVLVNNAGVFIERPIQAATIADWEETIDVNLSAVFTATKAALPYLLAADHGVVINIAAIASRVGYAEGSMYAASKHGLLGFSSSLLCDLREAGVKVSAILPGYVATDMHAGDPALDPKKMIQPHDIARAVRFIVDFPDTSCPTEITILPQRSPKILSKLK
jgi:NADP-dependent 3-hydroxy acid dehydrogenase YdfG